MIPQNIEIHETGKGELPERDYIEVFAYGHTRIPRETDKDDDWYLCEYTKDYGFTKTKGITRFMDIKYWFYPPAVENF